MCAWDAAVRTGSEVKGPVEVKQATRTSSAAQVEANAAPDSGAAAAGAGVDIVALQSARVVDDGMDTRRREHQRASALLLSPAFLPHARLEFVRTMLHVSAVIILIYHPTDTHNHVLCVMTVTSRPLRNDPSVENALQWVSCWHHVPRRFPSIIIIVAGTKPPTSLLLTNSSTLLYRLMRFNVRCTNTITCIEQQTQI